MIKFNHKSTDLQEALGMSKEEILKHFTEATKAYAENAEYTPTDEQKVAILVAMTNIVDSQMFSLMLKDINDEECSSTSELIEYLHKKVKNRTYYGLTALCIQSMED